MLQGPRAGETWSDPPPGAHSDRVLRVAVRNSCFVRGLTGHRARLHTRSSPLPVVWGFCPDFTHRETGCRGGHLGGLRASTGRIPSAAVGLVPVAPARLSPSPDG